MAKQDIQKGVTSKTIQIFIQDSSSSEGAGLTGLVFNSASLVAYYLRDGDAAPTVINLVDATVGTWTSGGFKEVSAANMPGVYELGLLDAILVAGAGVGQVIVMLKGAANMAPLPLELQLIDSYVMYAGGIWIDSGAANTNTVVGVDGLPSNPVSTLTAARTLADAIGIKKYYITNSSALTLAATHESWEFKGLDRSSILNLGSQDLDNSVFTNLSLAGTQGGTGFIKLVKCTLTSLLALRPWATECCIAGDITIQTGTMLSFVHCWSGVPGGLTPNLTFTAGITSVQFRDYSGGQTFKNGTSDHTVSYDCPAGQLIIDASSNGININARGNMRITDNGIATNLTDEAVYNQTIVKEQVDAALDSAIPGGPTAGSVNEVLKNQSGAASTIVDGAAVAGTLSTAEMTTDLTEVTNDHYNGRTIIWTSGVLLNQATAITDYDGATKKLTYVGTTEAPSIGDTFVII